MSLSHTLEDLIQECIEIERSVAAFGWSDELKRRASAVRERALTDAVPVGHLPAGKEVLLRLAQCGKGME